MAFGFAFNEEEFREDLSIEVEDIVGEMAREIADEIVKILVDDDHIATSKLADTTFYELDPNTPMGYIVGTEAPYALYVEYGTRPNPHVPFNKIADWVEVKFGYVGKERDDVAWAIVKKIQEEGIRGIRFIYRATDTVVRRHGGTQ